MNFWEYNNMQIIDGKKIRNEILEQLKEKVETLPFQPIFCDIIVGDDPVSHSYVKIKEKTAESIGIKFRKIEFANSATTEEIIEEINNLNNVPYMCGIIVQLPLPPQINTDKVLDAIDSKLDVDCLGQVASENFYNNQNEMGYPTALACAHLIDEVCKELKDKKVVIVGQGRLVGKPVAHLLRSRGLDVSIINSKTENKKEIIERSDVVISGVGRGKFITRDMVKSGAIIIDAGTSEENGSIVGDVDFKDMSDIDGFITPSPGGVGPVTVAMLLENVLKVAKNKK